LIPDEKVTRFTGPGEIDMERANRHMAIVRDMAALAWNVFL